MKKTFRRALACLLAVLMLALSMPFTALATQRSREWWVDEGIELSDIKGAPDFIGYHSDDYIDDYEELAQGEGTVNIEYGDPDFRDTYKPVMGIIVSSLGENSMTSGWTDYYNKCYGYSKTYNYARAEKDGKILNPAQLKKGQRIAVTVEYGGFDVISTGRFKAHWDPAKLQPGNYASNPKNSDTWAASTKLARTAQNLYASAITASEIWNPNIYEINLDLTYAGAASDPFGSGYVGRVDELSVGKYGFIACILTFEVLEDCDLKDALLLDDDAELGCFAQPYAQDYIQFRGDGLYNIALTDDPVTFAKWAVVYDSYEAGGTPEVPHTHDYQLTNTTPATCTTNEVKTYTCTNADGKCDVLTTTEETANSALGHNFAGTVTSLGNGQHTVQCTRCDATETVACTYTSTSLGATCTEGGSVKYTCACGYSYTDAGAPALGHDYKTAEEITTPATCTTDGVKTITTTCSRCDYKDVKTETIGKLGHDYKTDVVTVDATCTTDGSKTTTTTCSRCDYKDVKTETIEKLGHDYKTDVVTVDATCTTDGSKTTTTTCSRCDYKDVQVEKIDKLGHDYKTDVVTVEATYEADGSITTTTTCSRCDYKDVKAEVIPMLQGIKVTVVPSALGTATVNGKEVILDAVTVNVAANSDVTLTAKAVDDGVEFVGWNVDGKLVSTSETMVVKALADVTYVPVFQDAAAKHFTVIFTDRYGNIFATQTVETADQITKPEAPVIPGYTFTGWSLTDEEIAALTGAATIQAVYEKNETAGYTVKADGCTITVVASGETFENEATGLAYDTLVTVYKENTSAWQIGTAVVAYGESYTFYVGSDVTVKAWEGPVVRTPQVAAVSVTEVPVGDKIMASFLATRTMTDDCTYVSAGFIYGKNLANDDIKLADVDNATVKAYYCSTTSEQFSLNYGIAAQTGKITARAFLAYTNAQGAVEVVYAEPQTYVYA